MALLSRDQFYQQYNAAKQQGMSGGQAVNYLAQAAVAAQPSNNSNTGKTNNGLISRSAWNAKTGGNTWQPDSWSEDDDWNTMEHYEAQQPQYDVNAALKNLQNIAATTTDKQLAKTINKYTKGDAKKDNFWGQTAASFGSGKINELLNQAWGKYAEDGKDESKAIADAYAQLAEYYQNVNAEALDDENRKLKWLSQDMAQYTPQFMEQTKASAAPILGGAAAGALIGELVTPIPGLDALVGGLAGGVKGAMGGTIAGTKVGGLIGAGNYSYNTMRGAAMKSLLDAGATTEQAQQASRDEAIISTAIENLDNATDLFLLIPGMGGMGKAAAKSLLGKFAEWAGNVAQEGGEEFIQELISVANERRVKSGTTGDGVQGLIKEVVNLGTDIAKDAKNSEELKQALEAARGGAIIGGFMGPTGAAVNKVITGPMQNTALNAINDLAPNQEVAQQNRNFIAESNADSNARTAVNDYLREVNQIGNEQSTERTHAYNDYATALDQAKRNDVLVDGDGKLVGKVNGIAGNGFTVKLNKGQEAVFRSEASGSLNKGGAVYKALQSGGEFISEQEYNARQAEAEASVNEASEAMASAEMATPEEITPEAPAEMPTTPLSEMASESPVSDVVDEGISMPPTTPSESTEETGELVGPQSGEPYRYSDGNLISDAETLAKLARTMTDDQLQAAFADYGSTQFFSVPDSQMNTAEAQRRFADAEKYKAADKIIRDELKRRSSQKPSRQRILTLDEYGREDTNYELGGEVFSPEDVARMTEDDVKYRLNSWAKRLGLDDMRGLSEALSTILNANQTEDYAGSSIEKNTSKYAALQRGETVLPEIELIEELSDEELDELFALFDRAKELDLVEDINGAPEITTPNKEIAEKDFHGETAYGEQIKAIDEDIAEIEEKLNQIYSQSRLDFQKFDVPYGIPEATRLEKQLEQLQKQKAQLEDLNSKVEQENDKTARNPNEELEDYNNTELGEEAREEARAKREGKTFYGGRVASNGPSFIEASQMPAEHKEGSGGRVRGIKINGKTYYAVSSLEKGGYRHIMPDADVKAAQNLIQQMQDYVKQHNDAIQYYSALKNQGKPLPPKLPGLYRRVAAVQDALVKIENQGYTLQDLWNDRSLPADIISASPKNDNLRNYSLSAMANAVKVSEATRQINEMIGEQNDLIRNSGRNGEAQGRVSQNNGQRQEVRTPKSREEIASIAQRHAESKRNAQERTSNLDVQGQNTGTESGGETLGKKLRTKAKRITVNAAGKISNFVTGMKDAGYKVDTYKYNASDIAVAYDASSERQLNRDIKSPAARRILQKLDQRSDLDIIFADEFADYDNGQVNFDNGLHVTKDGRSVIFASDIQTATHESAHEDLSRMAPTFNSSEGFFSPSEMVESKTYAALKDAGVDVSKLEDAISNDYKKDEFGEEIFCELSACVETGLPSKFGPEFDAAAKVLKDSKEFRALMDDVYSQADAVGGATAPSGNRQKDISHDFSDDVEGDIADVMRMIEEDRKKPSLAEYKASRDAMEAESMAETTRSIEESFEENREESPKARAATQEERFGVKGDDRPLKLAQKVAEQSTKLKEKSVLNNDRKRAKMFGSNKAVQRATARFNGYMDLMNEVANAKKDITELFTYANTLKGDSDMGVYINDRVLDALRVAAQLEEESARTPTPDVVNAYKYQATKALAMAAQQAENVNRVQDTLQNGLIEAALKYSKGNTDNVLVKGAQWLNRVQLNPGNFFRMIGGYDRESRNTGYALQKRIDRQNAIRITTEARAKDFFSGVKKDKQFRDFANGKAKSNVKMGDHNLSMLQAVQFKMLCDTLGIDNIKTSRLETLNGFAVEDVGGNKTFIEAEGNTQAERYAWASRLYDQAVKDIEKNSAAKAYMEAAAKMFEDIKGDLISVGEKVDGYPKEMYAEGKYLPLSYASKDGHPMDWTLTNDMAHGLSTTRIMQERVRDNGGYAVIKPVSQTVDSYISQASNYIAYAELGNDLAIMGDANSLYGSIQDTIAKNFGDTYAQWYDNYTKSINQIKDVDPTGLNKVLGRARTLMQQGALLGSLSVPIKQISSYFSAMGVVDPRAVMKAYSPIRRSGNNIIDYMYKSRLQGSVDPDVSQALHSGWVDKLRKSGKLGETIVNATNIMDARTVANVYQACCYDVEMNSGLSMDEIYKDGDPKKGLTAAGELLVHSKFEQAVLNTQPIFNRQARAELARTSSEALRMLSTFRTQQTQNYNRLLQTINEAQAAKKFSGNTKLANRELRQTIGGQVAAAASISALTILADMVLHKHKKYKDDEDEFDEKKILERFALNFAEAGAGTALFTGDATKWLIDQLKGNTGDYASNKEFYGISMGAISSLKSAMNAWTWLYSDMLKGGKHAASDLRYAVNYTATLLGIPTQNAYNLMNSFYQYAGDILCKDIISGYGSEKFEDAMKEWDAIRTDYGNHLYSAIRAGNQAKAKEAVADMGDKFVSMIKSASLEQLKEGTATDEEVQSALMTYADMFEDDAEEAVKLMHMQIDTGYTSFAGTGEKSVKTAWSKGDISDQQAVNLYTKYSSKDKDSAKETVDGWKRDATSQKKYGYKYSELDDAYKDGRIKRSDYKNALINIGGKTAEQAELTISHNEFKKAYPGHTYQDINKMYLNGQMSRSEAIKWHKATNDTTEDATDNWIERLDFQKLTGYEANWRSTSDLYDTYSSKEKMGLMSFYDKYGKKFRSAKDFGRIFNNLNNVDRTDWPTYHNKNGYDATANQSRVITQMNSLIKSGDLSYSMAKTIWEKVYGWSTYPTGAWAHVKG